LKERSTSKIGVSVGIREVFLWIDPATGDIPSTKKGIEMKERCGFSFKSTGSRFNAHREVEADTTERAATVRLR
jgi:hypothetical protein